MTTTWKIEQLERTVPDGTVVTAHWRVTGVDGDYSATAYGSASFTRDEASPDFIPYEALTEDIVLGWLWAGGIDKTAYEQSMADQIEAQKNPTKLAGVPW